MRHVALAALLKLLEQTAETAVEHRSGGGAAENSAQCATQQVAKIAAAERSALSARRARADVTARGPGRLGGWRATSPAQVFRRIDRKKGEQRLGGRGLALACWRTRRARIVGDTAGLNAVENVEQAHVSLLTCPNPAQHRACARRLQGGSLTKGLL